jgi:adenosylcobinamide kinase/adenosylcobinamide-phosphate guanylyltransferase
MKTLLIGGARSGKSSLAARWALERSNDVCCIVTATPTDAEMSERIAAHRRERPEHWRVREEPVRLGTAVRDESDAGRLLLVDCLTLWTANCLWPGLWPGERAGEPQPDLAGWRRERDEFLGALPVCHGDVIIVTNEVGTGIVPENAAARAFRDEHGRLNQSVAAVCDEVFLVAAGLALRFKPER